MNKKSNIRSEVSTTFTRNKVKNILIFIGLLILISAVLYGAIHVQDATASNSKAVPMSGIFIDMNGDGRVDYVVSAQVILNNPTLTPSP